MKKIRQFLCPSCNHITESLVKDKVTIAECIECGRWAKRMLSAPKHFGNTIGKSPSAK